MKLKNLASRALSFLIFRNQPKLIITSSGRSGSTMVFNAVIEGIIINKFGSTYMKLFGSFTRDFISIYLKNLSEINSFHYIVYKNHEPYFLKYNNLTNHLYLFVYGDPLESALSVEAIVQKKGLNWFLEHQANLSGEGSYEDLYNKDILNYENIINSWLNSSESNILCIDYDDLWRNENNISNFLGFKVKLPHKKKRINKNVREINKELFDELRRKKNTYKTNRNYLNN
jgi:hypothetical protein